MTSPTQQPKIVETYTPKELAGALKIPYRRILTAITQGELRCTRYGERTRRIRTEDAAQWVVKLTR